MLRRQFVTLALMVLAILAVSAVVVTLPAVGTLQPAELLWTMVCTAGVVVHSIGLADALGDLSYVQRRGLHGPYLTVALGHIRTEAARLVAKALLTMVGVAAMVTPPNTELTRFLLTVALVASVALLTAESVMDRHDRRRMNERTEGANRG